MGPATGVTRGIALERLLVQVEDLVMDRIEKQAVDEVLDAGSEDEEEEEWGSDGGDGSGSSVEVL